MPGKLSDGVGDVADEFMLGKVDLVDSSTEIVDMNDFNIVSCHEKRWFFNHIVADIDNDVRTVNGTVQIIVVGQGGSAEAALMVLV